MTRPDLENIEDAVHAGVGATRKDVLAVIAYTLELEVRVRELEPLAEKGRELNEMIENIKNALGPNEELKPRVMQKTPKWP